MYLRISWYVYDVPLLSKGHFTTSVFWSILITNIYLFLFKSLYGKVQQKLASVELLLRTECSSSLPAIIHPETFLEDSQTTSTKQTANHQSPRHQITTIGPPPTTTVATIQHGNQRTGQTGNRLLINLLDNKVCIFSQWIAKWFVSHYKSQFPMVAINPHGLVLNLCHDSLVISYF